MCVCLCAITSSGLSYPTSNAKERQQSHRDEMCMKTLYVGFHFVAKGHPMPPGVRGGGVGRETEGKELAKQDTRFKSHSNEEKK